MVNAAGVTAAMLVDKNKRVSLRWEIKLICRSLTKEGHCFVNRHGCLVMTRLKSPLATNQSVTANWKGDISTSML